MKINNRLGVVATSLLLLAVGVTCLQTGSFAKRDTPKQKTSGKATASKPKTANSSNWKGVYFDTRDLICDDKNLLKLNKLKKIIKMASVNVISGEDITTMYQNAKVNGLQFIVNYTGSYGAKVDVATGQPNSDEVGKAPKLDVVLSLDGMTSPVKDSDLKGSLKGRKVKDFISLYLHGELRLVLRDRASGTIICENYLKLGGGGGGVADPGDFIVKPTPTPPPPAP